MLRRPVGLRGVLLPALQKSGQVTAGGWLVKSNSLPYDATDPGVTHACLSIVPFCVGL